MLILKRWLPAIIMCLFIFVSSSLPGATVSVNGAVDWSAHKLAHFIIYFLLCLTFYRATKNISVSILLAAVYGITDEFHQTFVPTRSGSVNDLVVDSLAAISAGAVLWKLYPILPQKLKNWLSE